MPSLYLPYNGGNSKTKQLYTLYNNSNTKVKQLYESNGTSWVRIFSGDIPYSSTYSFMDYGSAMDDTYFDFYVSGSSRGFYATIMFDQPIDITACSFSLSRQDADIDVHFSGYMQLNDVSGNSIAVASGSTDTSSSCYGSATNSTGTKIKSITLHASGSVSELYFSPYITTMGNSVQLSRYGQIQL